MAEMSRVTIPIDPGQIVRLKSGGPFMTIEEIDREGRYCCGWFWRGRYQSDKFKRHLIERADPDDVRTFKASAGAGSAE